MTGFLRWLGILNAAAWFGAALLLTLVVLPGVGSEEMKLLLGGRNLRDRRACYAWYDGRR